jgi:surface protein
MVMVTPGPDGFEMVTNPFPTIEEAAAAIEEMKALAVGPDGQRAISIGSRANKYYVAAALAVQRSLFAKSTGEPNYHAAAAHYVEVPNASSGESVKDWVEKLEKLQHIKRQEALAAQVVAMTLSAEDVATLQHFPLDDLLGVGSSTMSELHAPPLSDDLPVSALPSPPYSMSLTSTPVMEDRIATLEAQLAVLRRLADQGPTRSRTIAIQAAARRFLVLVAKRKADELYLCVGAALTIQHRFRRYMKLFLHVSAITKTALKRQVERLSAEKALAQEDLQEAQSEITQLQSQLREQEMTGKQLLEQLTSERDGLRAELRQRDAAIQQTSEHGASRAPAQPQQDSGTLQDGAPATAPLAASTDVDRRRAEARARQGQRPKMTNESIKQAVGEFKRESAVFHSPRAQERWGRVADWDVSEVRDMRELFKGAEQFNEDIGEWDVSNVTDMEQ